MTRSRAAWLVGLLAWGGSHALAQTDDTVPTPRAVPGTLFTGFNNGQAAVRNTPGQALYTAVARNQAAQRSDQAHGFAILSTTEGRGGALQGRLGAAGVEDLAGGFDAAFGLPLGSVGDTVAGVANVAVLGPHTIVGANYRRSNGTFESWIHQVGYSSGAPQTEASLRVGGDAASEEILGLAADEVAGSYGKPSATIHALSITQVSSECHEPKYHRVPIDPQSGTLSPVGAVTSAFAAPFRQCHTKYGKIDRQSGTLSPVGAPVPRPAEAVPKADATSVRSIVLGVRCRETPTAIEQFCLYRLRDDGTTLALDPSFGGGDGQLVLRSADPTLPLRYWSHAVDDQNRVLVAYGQGRSASAFTPVVLRVRADGTVDTSFGTGGVVQIPVTGPSANPRTLTLDIHGNIQVSGETYTPTSVRPFAYFLNRTSAPGAPETYTPQLVEYALANYPNSAFFAHVREPDGTLTAVGAAYLNYPDTATMRPLIVQLIGPPAARPAIEYFNAGFGHYISVVNPDEIRKLDTGEFVGWTRTGYFFNVYPIGTPRTTPVDRFFTTAFAPKSSHVFSANAVESAAIRQNPVWQFEGPVFGAILPSAEGLCPPSTRRVSRVYNNGLTGAPNHRFADDADVVTQAAATGTLEGAGPRGAFYCTE